MEDRGRCATRAADVGDGADSPSAKQEAKAASLMIRAAAAAMVVATLASALLTLACLPFLLVLPFVYFASEALFVGIYLYKAATLNELPALHRPHNHDPWTAFERTMEHVKQFEDGRRYLSLWFHCAPFDSIKRGNVAEMLAYAFFYRTLDAVHADGLGPELSAMLARLEELWHLGLPEGHNPHLTFMSHLWEPLRHEYRPLGFYLAMEAATALGTVALAAAGFKRRTHAGVVYYARLLEGCEAEAAGGPPLVLLHGVGMGLLPYIPFLCNLAAMGRPLLALECKHVAMRLVLNVPTVDDVAETLEGVLRAERLGPAALVAHSYGTAVASRLLQRAPRRVAQLVLIDPVVFAMFMPNMLRSFIYTGPNSGSVLGDWLMSSAARELHIAAALCRRFYWSDVNLWAEQLPDRCLVVLSGRDALVAAREVRMWLEWASDAELMFHAELPHAGFLVDLAWQRRIVASVLRLLDMPATPAEARARHGNGHLRGEQVQPGAAAGAAAAGRSGMRTADSASSCQGMRLPAVNAKHSGSAGLESDTGSSDSGGGGLGVSVHSRNEVAGWLAGCLGSRPGRGGDGTGRGASECGGGGGAGAGTAAGGSGGCCRTPGHQASWYTGAACHEHPLQAAATAASAAAAAATAAAELLQQHGGGGCPHSQLPTRGVAATPPLAPQLHSHRALSASYAPCSPAPILSASEPQWLSASRWPSVPPSVVSEPLGAPPSPTSPPPPSSCVSWECASQSRHAYPAALEHMLLLPPPAPVPRGAVGSDGGRAATAAAVHSRATQQRQVSSAAARRLAVLMRQRQRGAGLPPGSPV